MAAVADKAYVTHVLQGVCTFAVRVPASSCAAFLQAVAVFFCKQLQLVVLQAAIHVSCKQLWFSFLQAAIRVSCKQLHRRFLQAAAWTVAAN